MNLKAQLEESLQSKLVGNIVEDNDIIQSIIQKTFLWLGGITAIVFAVGFYIAKLIENNVINPSQYTIAFWVSVVLGFILMIAITWFYQKMNYTTLAILAILFAVAEGVGLTGVLAVYNTTAIINAFAGAALLFIIMAIYLYTTKADLTKLGTILMVGLITIIVFSLLNAFFFHSSGFELVLSIAGLLIFLGLTAWDLQLLKQMAATGDRRLEIVFGISLFLDFINIFLELLKIFASSDDD